MDWILPEIQQTKNEDNDARINWLRISSRDSVGG